MAQPLARTPATSAAAEAPRPREAPRRLRIVSANLWNGVADAAYFASLVREVGADVAAVQEIGPEQAEALREILPHGDVDPRVDYQGMGILARAPLRLEKVEMPYRSFWVAQLEGEGWASHLGSRQRLELLNVHLAAPHVGLPLPRGLVARRGQVRTLDRYLRDASAEARVLVGDLNATPMWPAYQRVVAHLADAAVEVAQRRGRRRLEPTWSRKGRGRRLLRIDHGFVRGVTATEFLVIPLVRSDHAAILMDVELG